MAYRLTGSGTEPQCIDLIVVATAVANPVGAVVEQHHHLVFGEVGFLGVNEAQLVDFQLIESLAFLQQVLFVHLIGIRTF